jgi:hypothetical protein
MVVCSCRDIRDSQYSNKEELIARLLEDDYCCGTCLEDLSPCTKNVLTTQTKPYINRLSVVDTN